MFNKKQNYFVTVQGTSTDTLLSMSDAQALSNICHQKASGIAAKLAQKNNYTKTVDLSTLVNSNSNKVLTKVVPYPIELEEVRELVVLQGNYHAFQAFLMEHIKLKESMIKDIKYTRDKGFIKPTMEEVLPGEHLMSLIPSPHRGDSSEDRVWENVDKNDILRYIIEDSKAAHIGMFIHKDSRLDKLRKEVTKLPEFEFENLPDGRVAICTITKHHTVEGLEEVHLAFADMHRDSERVVNAIKAKVKDNTTQLETEHQITFDDEFAEYQRKMSEINLHNHNLTRRYETAVEKQRTEHVVACNKELDSIVKSKLLIPKEFKALVEEFNKARADKAGANK